MVGRYDVTPTDVLGRVYALALRVGGNRLDADEAFIATAVLLSLRGTCPRARVGCVLVDAKGYILATGYNGVPRGQSHCLDVPCPGAADRPGERELCEATHAEANALLRCGNVERVATCYVTRAPCPPCVRLLLNTACKRVVFLEVHSRVEEARALWLGKHHRLIKPQELWAGYQGSERRWERFER